MSRKTLFEVKTMTTSIPASIESNPSINPIVTSNTQTPESLKKIDKLTILSIITIVATTLCTAAGIISATVTGIAGLFALPVAAILLAIAVLIAIHKHRCSKELSMQKQPPSLIEMEPIPSSTTSETKESKESKPYTLEDIIGIDSTTPRKISLDDVTVSE
ncbi:hypothetical protein CPS0C_0437 [Chlamydia psittaci C19/98]|nr:hypothetical protein CPS0C_0437 [Chlamydia psittaci C19/98]AEG86423.1 hypothetical protein CPS0A_0436 [Chlamydia psittaci 01DC11]AEG87397.1 hypothetical protein CPS0B_0433 [Chlamydia psittaci 02DC15]AEG88373.1 hypothetical protein CPS0D_0435 [Chlamydia psittaci 08DC60]EPJ29744.1 hypothetical protein CP09DC78_0843 [Chlamydia psittaci 09DC78]EPL00287.1 hypothetical protein CP02DC24_0118 [Chlamydia psittaci 02DC24]EPL01088.1 hypothetical protein CP09DC79_0568 [Chlamydia psittaci 09DC79]EPP27